MKRTETQKDISNEENAGNKNIRRGKEQLYFLVLEKRKISKKSLK